MAYRFSTCVEDLTTEMLEPFFEGWRHPPTPAQRRRIFQGSARVVLAREESGKVVGFVAAITDGAHSAFITLLEVLPEHRRRGVGSELMRRMLVLLEQYPCIDLICDPDLQPFYAKLGFSRAVGMSLRTAERMNRVS